MHEEVLTTLRTSSNIQRFSGFDWWRQIILINNDMVASQQIFWNIDPVSKSMLCCDLKHNGSFLLLVSASTTVSRLRPNLKIWLSTSISSLLFETLGLFFNKRQQNEGYATKLKKAVKVSDAHFQITAEELDSPPSSPSPILLLKSRRLRVAEGWFPGRQFHCI